MVGARYTQEIAVAEVEFLKCEEYFTIVYSNIRQGPVACDI